jgi:hypothetical protein
VEQLAKNLGEAVSALEEGKVVTAGQLLDRANVAWTKFHVTETHGERLRHALAVSQAIADYVAFDRADPGGVRT